MIMKGIDVFTGIPVELEIENGLISRRRELQEIEDIQEDNQDHKLPYLSPGWVDIQVNGWMGLDYNGDTLDADSFSRICMKLAASGTTRHLPTIITASQNDILRRLKTLRKLRDESPWMASRVPGFHVEGPFISKLDGPRGAHNSDFVRDSSIEEFEAWQEAAGGLIRIVTLAPESPGAADFIEYVSSRNVVVSLGHSGADPGLVREAVAAGATMSTHLGNGLSRTIPRYENPLWEQLASDQLTASIIADGFHLPPAFIKTVCRTKGSGRVVLISDAAPPGGLGAGTTVWAGMKVDVSADGRISLAGTPYLAGAGHLQDRGIGFYMDSTGCSLADAVRACTVTPAAMIGLAPESVSLQEGSPADIVAFRLDSGTRVAIETVWLDGSVYSDSQF